LAKKLRKLPRKKEAELKAYLDEVILEVEVPDYIDSDPIQFMHAFSDKRDMEIAGFFAAIMAWGRRDIVIAKVDDLLQRMDYKPYEFILNFNETDAYLLDDFKHRTFKPTDIYWFIRILQQIYTTYPDFEAFWAKCYRRSSLSLRPLIAIFHEEFFSIQPETPQRSRKHISNPEKNSSAKRLYMYLRWCLRKKSPVDLGIWDFMPLSEIKIPLDVHVAKVARNLGLLTRTYDDWKAVNELNDRLLRFDKNDPSRYDFALFGIGVLAGEIPEQFLINQK
jgi:uncharacterized protein (TIGR02757 family)